jgi:hypothetical protein
MMIANAQNMHTATVTAERPYGIRVRLKASDPFTLLMGKEWEKTHWFATAMERDQRLADMQRKHEYSRKGDLPTLLLEAIEQH